MIQSIFKTHSIIPSCTGTQPSTALKHCTSSPLPHRAQPGRTSDSWRSRCDWAMRSTRNRDWVEEDSWAFTHDPSNDSLVCACWRQANNCWWLFVLAASPEGWKCTSQISHKPVNNWKQHVFAQTSKTDLKYTGSVWGWHIDLVLICLSVHTQAAKWHKSIPTKHAKQGKRTNNLLDYFQKTCTLKCSKQTRHFWGIWLANPAVTFIQTVHSIFKIFHIHPSHVWKVAVTLVITF